MVRPAHHPEPSRRTNPKSKYQNSKLNHEVHEEIQLQISNAKNQKPNHEEHEEKPENKTFRKNFPLTLTLSPEERWNSLGLSFSFQSTFILLIFTVD